MHTSVPDLRAVATQVVTLGAWKTSYIHSPPPAMEAGLQ